MKLLSECSVSHFRQTRISHFGHIFPECGCLKEHISSCAGFSFLEPFLCKHLLLSSKSWLLPWGLEQSERKVTSLTYTLPRWMRLAEAISVWFMSPSWGFTCDTLGAGATCGHLQKIRMNRKRRVWLWCCDGSDKSLVVEHKIIKKFVTI